MIVIVFERPTHAIITKKFSIGFLRYKCYTNLHYQKLRANDEKVVHMLSWLFSFKIGIRRIWIYVLDM